MFNFTRTILDGLILSGIASVFIVISMLINPRIWLQDYPEDIQNMVAPKSDSEKRLSLIIGIPFLILIFVGPFFSTLFLKFRNPDASFLDLSLNAFGVVFIFNVVDWLLLDWLMFCTLTPRFVVIPGSEGMEGYKNYYFHFRGFLKGTVICVLAGLVISGIVSLL
jgi:hypothetical protein